jgi:hypothetical protein
VKPDRPEPPPLSHRGFQLGVRTGVVLPAGRLSDENAMSALATAQIPLFADIGAKISRHVFLGGYASFGIGGVTDRWDRDQCLRNDCNAGSVHIGGQIQVHFAPAERANPWLGYGLGYEWLWTNGFPATTYRGPEYGRFMAGIDFRLSHDFGLGPFVDATLARYTSVTTEERLVGGQTAATTETTSDIDNTSLHSWITVGLRFVLYP